MWPPDYWIPRIIHFWNHCKMFFSIKEEELYPTGQNIFECAEP